MPTQNTDTQPETSWPMWPIGVTVLVETPRYTVVRINPTHSDTPAWYSIRVNAYWRFDDFLAAREVLPDDVECEGSYQEGDEHYFDMVSPTKP